MSPFSIDNNPNGNNCTPNSHNYIRNSGLNRPNFVTASSQSSDIFKRRLINKSVTNFSNHSISSEDHNYDDNPEGICKNSSMRSNIASSFFNANQKVPRANETPMNLQNSRYINNNSLKTIAPSSPYSRPLNIQNMTIETGNRIIAKPKSSSYIDNQNKEATNSSREINPLYDNYLSKGEKSNFDNQKSNYLKLIDDNSEYGGNRNKISQKTYEIEKYNYDLKDICHKNCNEDDDFNSLNNDQNGNRKFTKSQNYSNFSQKFQKASTNLLKYSELARSPQKNFSKDKAVHNNYNMNSNGGDYRSNMNNNSNNSIQGNHKPFHKKTQNNNYEGYNRKYNQHSSIIKARVKSVLSGDTFVVYEGKDSKIERTLKLYNIYAPKLGRKPSSVNTLHCKTTDEAFAWESREFLRELIVGHDVKYEVKFTMDEYRIFVIAYFDDCEEDLNSINNIVLSNGFACLKTNIAKDDEIYKNMKKFEDVAVNQRIGIWQDPKVQLVRKISWCVDDLRPLLKSINKLNVPIIVEQIIDECVMRVLFIESQTNTWNYFLIKLMGVKPLIIDRPGPSQIKLYLERNLLQRDLTLLTDDIWAKQYIIGTLFFNDSNYSMHLLDIGFFEFDKLSYIGNQNWEENYINLSEKAKLLHVGLWNEEVVLNRNNDSRQSGKPTIIRNIQQCPSDTTNSSNTFTNNQSTVFLSESASSSKYSTATSINNCDIPKNHKSDTNFPHEFDAEVLEIGPGDSFIIKHPNEDSFKRVFFSSTIFTKHFDHYLKGQIINSNNRVFLIPYLYEAREYLRKNFLGKNVHFILDYIVDSKEHAPERVCCTAIYNNLNIGRELIAQGLALCMRHKKDDMGKSQHYHTLLDAENYAMSQKLCIHSDFTDTRAIKCIDMTHMPELVKPVLGNLLDLKNAKVIVESVLTSVRFRLYVSNLNIIISFIVGGLMAFKCNPNAPKDRTTTSNGSISDDIFGESVRYAKRLCLHQDAVVNFEFMGRGGNLIGNIKINGKDVALSMLSNGYAQVNWDFLPSNYDQQRIEELKDAEEQFRMKGSKICDESNQNLHSSLGILGELLGTDLRGSCIRETRRTNFMPCVISDMRPNLSFSIQLSRDESVIIMISETLNSPNEALIPLEPSELVIGTSCAARDIDNEWYRARIVQILDDSQVSVYFLDFGNCITTSSRDLLVLPDFLKSLPPQCSQYRLSFVSIPEATQTEAFSQFRTLVTTQFLLLNHEFTAGSSSASSDVNKNGNNNSINQSETSTAAGDKSNNYKVVDKYASILLTQDNVDVSSHLLRNGLLIVDPSIYKIKDQQQKSQTLNYEASIEDSKKNVEISESIDVSFFPLIEKYLDDERFARSNCCGIWSRVEEQKNVSATPPPHHLPATIVD